MPEMLARCAPIHIRVTPDLKRAVKVLCAQSGTTEQSWILARMIEAELNKQALELFPRQRRAFARPPRWSR